MLRSRCDHRRVKPRRFPRFEPLESRVALTGDGGADETTTSNPLADSSVDGAPQWDQSPLSLNLINPAQNEMLTASPLSLLLEFNRPIFPDTVDDDVLVVKTDAGGNPISFTVPGPLAMDRSDTWLSAPLAQALASGHYQVWILSRSGIMDLDGVYLTDGVTNLVVGQFDVAVSGIRLDNAVELGTVGPTPLEVPGFLDFQADAQAVSLYEVVLPPGHFWRLGIEVSAQRDGGSLDTALALFDASGRLIASDDLGRPDAPMDPYLFAGLTPGTYYVGVSGVGDLPGLPGGFDPATGTPGSVEQTQDGGPFTIHLVADPADTPPTIVNLSVDRADPEDATPTGLTLTMSRAIAVTGQFGFRETSLSNTIEVVDQTGRIWTVQASDYSESAARISYLFDQRLPPGHYQVVLPVQGGLTDLAGLSPVAPGYPAGVLGEFDVAPHHPGSDPQNLGALLPALATSGLAIGANLSKGESMTYRFVVTVPGQYIFQEQSSGRSPSVRLSGADLDRLISSTGTNDTFLAPGVYSIRFDARPVGTVDTRLFLRLSSDQTEIILANGVGQGPGLSLRLITDSAVAVDPPTTTTTPVFGPLPAETPPSTPQGGSESGNHAPASPVFAREQAPPVIPSSVTAVVMTSFLALGSDLVGRPSIATSSTAISPPEAGNGVNRENPSFMALDQPPGPLRHGSSRFAWDSSGAIISGLETAIPRRVSQASLIGFGPRTVIDIPGGLRRWVARQGESLLNWAGSWFSGLPQSDPTGIPVTRLFPGMGRRRAVSGSEGDLRKNAEESGPWSEWTSLLSPSVVVVSVTATSQVCWHYLQWRKRKRAELDRASMIPAPRLAWDRLHASLLIGTHPRVSP